MIRRLSLLKNKDGQWSVRVIAKNGEIVMASEGFTRKADARRAARWLRRQLSYFAEIV